MKRSELDRIRRHERMRRRILNAAMQLFLSKGFDNVTMRNIARRVGYSPAALYRYFENRSDIFFALRGQGFEEFLAMQMTTRTISDPLERLHRHAEVYAEFGLENPEYYKLMFVLGAPLEQVHEKEEWAATAHSFELLKEDIRDCMAAGLMPAAEVDAAALTFWSVMHGIVSLIIGKRLALHTKAEPDTLVRGTIDYLFQLLNSGTTEARKW